MHRPARYVTGTQYLFLAFSAAAGLNPNGIAINSTTKQTGKLPRPTTSLRVVAKNRPLLKTLKLVFVSDLPFVRFQ